MSRNSFRRTLVAAAALLMLAALVGCKPDNIFFSVKNESGGTLHDVKVTYPGDELNVGTLDGTPNTSQIFGTFRHFDGPGIVTVTYTTERGSTYSHSSPPVAGSEKGNVKINIEGSSANFEMNFDASQQ
jgi:hypothetical protein